MKILTIEWVENEAECKYVAPIDERAEEGVRSITDWDNYFVNLVVRNRYCINYFSVQVSTCTLVKIGDDVLLDTRKKAEPKHALHYSLVRSEPKNIYGIRRGDGKVAWIKSDGEAVRREIESMSKDRARERLFTWEQPAYEYDTKTVDKPKFKESMTIEFHTPPTPAPEPSESQKYHRGGFPHLRIKREKAEPKHDTKTVEDYPPKVKLPPVGVKPRYLHDEQRMEDLEGAIERYLAAGATPKKEWLEELEELKRRYEPSEEQDHGMSLGKGTFLLFVPPSDYTVIDTLIASGRDQWSDKPPKLLKIGQCPNCLAGIEIKGQYAVKCWNCGQTCLEKLLR